MKREWELRKQHEEDISRILEETGCLDSKGRLRTWKGPLVAPLIEAAGHCPGRRFEDCRCRRAP